MWVVDLVKEYFIPFTIIYEGTRGVRWWKGQVQLNDLGPGFYFYVPYLHRIEATASCYQEVDTLVQQFTTKDGKTVSLSANVGYEVWNAALWWTRVYHFDTTVERKIRKILFQCLQALTYDEIRDSLPALTEIIHERLQRKVYSWGVRIVEVEFTDFADTMVIRLLNETNTTVLAPMAAS